VQKSHNFQKNKQGAVLSVQFFRYLKNIHFPYGNKLNWYTRSIKWTSGVNHECIRSYFKCTSDSFNCYFTMSCNVWHNVNWDP